MFSPDVSAVAPSGGPVTTVLAGASEATASPDGRSVAFLVRDTSGYDVIHVADADGSRRRRVMAPDPKGFDEGPTWSPDGRWLAFHRRSALCTTVGSPPVRTCIPHWSVYAVRVDGTGLRRLTPDSLQATRPAW